MGNIVRMLSVPILVFSMACATAGPDQALRIHRYSAFQAAPVQTGKSASARSRTQVNVYGKRLTLNLENNTQLLEQLSGRSAQTSSQIAVLRGALEGKTKSWVRLTQTTSGTHGLIWDGAELYVIEPSSSVSNTLAVSLPEPDSATVIFKLSDTTLDLGGDYCGSAHSSENAGTTGLATYQALTTELSEQVSVGDIATLRLEMQVLTDAAFRAQYSSDQQALEALMVRLNNIDGIFTSQVGLEVQATDIEIQATDPVGLSPSTDANTLLGSLSQLRYGDPVMHTYALTHLFTGRDLDGDTLGIAYIGNICEARHGVSLSEVRTRGAWIDSLVTAHELGHQLGAVHDGTGVCGGTAAQGYLMGEQINGSSELSQCSRDSILATMQHAACLVPVGAPDISLSDGAVPESVPDTSFHWSLPIRNQGTGAADQPTIHLTLPGGLIVESSAISGGSCVASNSETGGIIDCVFDTLAANETRMLELSLRASQAGNYQVSADVGAVGDNNPLNNSAVYNVSVTATNIEPPSTTATAGEPAGRGHKGGGGAFNILTLLALAALISRGRLTKHAA